ncbi:hypothetical protein [Sutcliffiella deserti]|uniref:hypothetical protein n=1 Tax=Sutcliffiella deserti TaxID=2875501 RepID=UPI001CBAAFB2|nr:hypothetical protein [Sutcliffiella deserti]
MSSMFLVFLILLVMLVFIPRLSKKRLWTASSNMNIKFMIGYIGVLLLSASVFYLLPEKQVMESVMLKNETVSSDNLYVDLIHDRTVDGKYIKKKSSTPYEKSKLHLKIEQPNDHFQGTLIIVKRDPNLTDRVEATTYVGKSFAGEIDISDKVPYSSFLIKEDTLTIIKPPETEIQFDVFKSEFSFSQFTAEGWMHTMNSSSFGTVILYLEVPVDLEVTTDDDLYIEEIGT